MNDEVARVQVGDLDVGQRDAVIVAEIDHCIVAAVYRLKGRLGYAGLCFGQEHLQSCSETLAVGGLIESVSLI